MVRTEYRAGTPGSLWGMGKLKAEEIWLTNWHRIVFTGYETSSLVEFNDWKVAQETKREDGSAASEQIEGYQFDGQFSVTTESLESISREGDPNVSQID